MRRRSERLEERLEAFNSHHQAIGPQAFSHLQHIGYALDAGVKREMFSVTRPLVMREERFFSRNLIHKSTSERNYKSIAFISINYIKNGFFAGSSEEVNLFYADIAFVKCELTFIL